MSILMRIIIGGGTGLLAGAALGYFSKCSSGECPLTANPLRGSIFGAIIGTLLGITLISGGGVKKPHVEEISSVDDFRRLVLNADRPVLVDFYSPDCGPCRRLAPEIDNLARRYSQRLDVYKVDVSKAGKLARMYDVIKIPTVMLFSAGRRPRRWVGIMSTQVYNDAIQEALDRRKKENTEMNERIGIITFKGEPLTLLGAQVNEGDTAPDATVLDNDLNEVSISEYRGKVCLIASVPSLDTSVCSTETRRFNEEAAALGDDVAVLTISMDLPFAQKRWCGAAGIENVRTLSDHRDAEFGTNWGVLIKELRLLARMVFVVDAEGVVKYIQTVREMTDEPDYDEALQAVKQAQKQNP